MGTKGEKKFFGSDNTPSPLWLAACLTLGSLRRRLQQLFLLPWKLFVKQSELTKHWPGRRLALGIVLDGTDSENY